MIDWEQMAKYYEALLTSYQLKFEPRLKRSQLILNAQMTLLEIDLEMKSYELKKGNSKALEERRKRNELLTKVIDELSSLEQENEHLRLIANTAIAERNAYRYRLKMLEEKLKDYEKFMS